MAHQIEQHYTLREALQTGQLYALWALIFLNGSVGLGLISQAAPLAQELTGAGAIATGTLVGAISLGNVAGRFCWLLLSDGIGWRAVFVALFLLEAVAFLALPHATTLVVFGFLAFLVVLSYGGGLGTMPALVADYFGPENVGPIFGLIMTGSGLGSVLGPALVARGRELTGSYDSALLLLSGMILASSTIPLFLRPPRGLETRTEAGPRRTLAAQPQPD